MRKSLNVVAAFLRGSRGIGWKGDLPWNPIKEDMQRFARTTTKAESGKINSVIMGRKTWESLPDKHRPLSNRLNIIISNTLNINERDNVRTFRSLDEAIRFTDEHSDIIDRNFVIGGEQLFQETVSNPRCDKLYLTEVLADYDADVFFPDISKEYHLAEMETKALYSSDGTQLLFKTYQNIMDFSSDEYKYLNLVEDIISNGEEVEGRNGTVFTTFGAQHLFDLTKGFPLLTTKKMFIKGVVEELLFFLRGETDSRKLEKKGVKIWTANTSGEFLDQRGLTDYSVGDMGPMYGWQWRHFGAKYEGCDKNYTGKGYDQLYYLLSNIITFPQDRRLLLTTYDPSKVAESVLAPCHGLTIQFHVTKKGELDCKMYQRSVDVALGYPFNIASYALLTHLIAHVTGLKPRHLIMTLGNTHIYEKHAEPLIKQLERTPLQFPKLLITKEFKGISTKDRVQFLENLSRQHIYFKDYYCYPGIKMDMVA